LLILRTSFVQVMNKVLLNLTTTRLRVFVSSLPLSYSFACGAKTEYFFLGNISTLTNIEAT